MCTSIRRDSSDGWRRGVVLQQWRSAAWERLELQWTAMTAYKFKEKLQLLLDVGGAKAVYVETPDSCSQNPGDNLVCVMPAGLTSSTGSFNKFNSLPKVNEMELISQLFLDIWILQLWHQPLTVVADSDVELETATSVRTSVAIDLVESAGDERERKIEIHLEESSVKVCKAENIVHIVESNEHDSGGNLAALKTSEHGGQGYVPPDRDTLKPDSPCRTAVKSDGEYITSSRNRDEDNVTRKDKGHASESENLDIIYSQNLIVRESNLQQPGPSSINGAAINFKRFRKMSAPSGNSFSNLIPFAKHPYEASDYGNEDVAEAVKEEKKRKQMEAIADDLFNHEKGRKRGATGSLRGLFARG
ncbi:hypothetical protein DH2020_038732 [Rehmannia glutinosa]|uniref:Uncharacterized protein n=1 Tax=Rehmannia glutinosa TaxID=99300 RepID=A0ABR0UYX3_REHGL